MVDNFESLKKMKKQMKNEMEKQELEQELSSLLERTLHLENELLALTNEN